MEVFKFIDTISNLGAFGIVLFFLYALYKGWVVLGRELRKCEIEREEYKQLVFHSLRIGESAANLAETLQDGKK